MAVGMQAASVKSRTTGSIRVSESRGISVGARARSGIDPGRKDDTERAAEHGQQEALGQQLPDDPPPSGAERETDRELSLPGGARARRRCATLAQEMRSTSPTAPRRVQSVARNSPNRASVSGGSGLLSGVGLRIRLLEVAHDAVELRPRGFEARARGQPREGPHPGVVSAFEPARDRAVQTDGRVEVDRSGKKENPAGSTPTTT